VVLKCPKPIRDYPLRLVTVSDHLRKRRLDLRLTKVEAGRRLGIRPWTYSRWESGGMNIEVHYYPHIIAFLGYNPLPEPRSLAEAVRRERMSHGLPRWALARRLGIQYEGTIQRIEQGAAVSSRCLRKVCIALGLNEMYNEHEAGGH
jgi:transcriptional regulator with XRE-family HTH domain